MLGAFGCCWAMGCCWALLSVNVALGILGCCKVLLGDVGRCWTLLCVVGGCHCVQIISSSMDSQASGARPKHKHLTI